MRVIVSLIIMRSLNILVVFCNTTTETQRSLAAQQPLSSHAS